MKIIFPKDFWWGSAMSGPQVEGGFFEDGKSATIWDEYFRTNRSRFFNSTNVKNDFYNNYKEDIKLAKQAGFNSLRTSIQWTRLIPDGKNVNQKGVEFYNKVIDEMIKNDIEPFITLFHFDMPLWAQKKGGWESREVIEAFSFYAKTAFNLFGDRVKKWFTFNEPNAFIAAGYMMDYFPPNKVSWKDANKAVWGTLVAHFKAVKQFRNLNIDGAKIGVVLNIMNAIPRSNNSDDVDAAKIFDETYWRCFAEPMINNKKPENWIKFISKYKQWDNKWIQKEDLNLLKNYKIDLLGVNYYQPHRVKTNNNLVNLKSPSLLPKDFFETYHMPGKRMNYSRGWEIYPKGIYDFLKLIKNEFRNIDSYISENGLGISGEDKFKNTKGVIQDKYRIDFITEHLYWTHKALNEGVNIKGYHTWAYIDNWSWPNAYKNRYGIYELDLTTGKRKPKLSLDWTKKLIKDKGFEIDIKDIIDEPLEQ